MSVVIANFSAGVVIALTFLTSIASCGMVPSQSQRPTPEASPTSSATSQKREGKYDRVAIPDIKGCLREQITFYKGKVLSFKRQESSVEITIRTEWETTETLSQPKSENPIEFRLKGQPLKDQQWKQIESLLSDPSHPLAATVWVCQLGGKDQIKIIDWQPPPSQ